MAVYRKMMRLYIGSSLLSWQFVVKWCDYIDSSLFFVILRLVLMLSAYCYLQQVLSITLLSADCYFMIIKCYFVECWFFTRWTGWLGLSTIRSLGWDALWAIVWTYSAKCAVHWSTSIECISVNLVKVHMIITCMIVWSKLLMIYGVQTSFCSGCQSS